MSPPKAIRDFLGTLNYLMGNLSLAQKGDLEELLCCFPYVKQQLEAAKGGLEKLQVLQEATAVIADVEVFVGQGLYETADQRVLAFARMLSDISGENDRLRRIYGGHSTNPYVH